MYTKYLNKQFIILFVLMYFFLDVLRKNCKFYILLFSTSKLYFYSILMGSYSYLDMHVLFFFKSKIVNTKHSINS